MENTNKANSQIVIFTHGIDIDGFGGAILGKLAFENPTIVFADNFDLDEKFVKTLQTNPQFEKIYIVDHCPSFDLCKKIQETPEIASKIMVFDHHKSRQGKEDQFDFVNLVVENAQGKQSGTSLFYDYLTRSGLLRPTKALKEFAKLTTLYDNWLWKEDEKDGKNAYRLNTFFQAVGREKFIGMVLKTLQRNSDKFEFNEEENQIIDNFIQSFNAKVNSYIKQMKIAEHNGLKFGFVEVEDLFKNDIPEVLRSLNNPLGISYVMMPIKNRESVSLRHIQDVDLSKIAEEFGGGGHKYAASFPKSSAKYQTLIKTFDDKNK